MPPFCLITPAKLAMPFPNGKRLLMGNKTSECKTKGKIRSQGNRRQDCTKGRMNVFFIPLTWNAVGGLSDSECVCGRCMCGPVGVCIYVYVPVWLGFHYSGLFWKAPVQLQQNLICRSMQHVNLISVSGWDFIVQFCFLSFLYARSEGTEVMALMQGPS